MKKTKSKIKAFVWILAAVIIILLALAAFLFYRQDYTQVEGETVSRDETYIDLRGSREVKIDELMGFNAPETIDLRAAAVSAGDVASLRSKYPNCRILWTVEVCEGLNLENEAAAATVIDGEQARALAAASGELCLISEIKVDYPNIAKSDYDALAAAFPDAEIEYSVVIRGEEIPLGTEKLDFSDYSYEEVMEAAELLEMLPNVSEIELMTAEGTSPFSLDEVVAIQETCPDIKLNYSFELFGQSVNTGSTQRLEYYDTEIGDEGLDTFRKVLPIMHGLKYLRFDSCGTTDEAVAQLREEFPEVKIAWLLTVGLESFYTDTLRLRVNFNFLPEDMWKLKYCNEVKYIDAGHILSVFDVEWARYMPDLEVCIIIGTNVTDISPLAECENLEFLEIFSTRITDISPLAECENLQYLNMGATIISDISPIFGLEKIKKVNCNRSYSVPLEQIEEFRKLHPDAIFNYYPHLQNVDSGWRFSGPYTYDERYALLREQMGYDDPKAARNGGYLQAPID